MRWSIKGRIKWWISLFVCALASAGPVEFGMSELNAALSARGLKWKAKAELSLDLPETYRIELYRAGGAHITGGDLRGLMYGLIEASEQVRSTGRLAQAHGAPATAMRGVRVFIHASDLEKYSDAFWRAYFQLLARDRFNHFNLVFLHRTPYPYLLPVEGFSAVRVTGLTSAQRDRNLRALRFISQTASEYGLDFTLGIWEPDGSSVEPGVEGLARSNLGPYSRDGLRKLLAACPVIRGVQIQAHSENVAFYRESIFKALHEAGHRVTLDPRGSLRQAAFLKAAQDAGVVLQPSGVPWPGGFEMDPPLAAGHPDFERHAQFYWLWGRLSYDPDLKPAKSDKPEEYRAAYQTIHLLIDAHRSDPNMYTWPAANPGGRPDGYTDDYKDVRPGDWGFVASIPEAVHNRLEGLTSAKQTPLETADLLTSAGASLEHASSPDLRLLFRLALYHAHKQRAAYDLELFDRTGDPAALDDAERELSGALAAWESLEKTSSGAENPPAELPDMRLGLALLAQRRQNRAAGPAPAIPSLPKRLPRPQFAHTPVKNAPPDQPLTLTLQITTPKDVRAIRLHYRSMNPGALFKTLEKPPAASMSFTIPAPDVPSNWDLLYYFEVLNSENGGWFEPDPLATAPYHVVKIVSPN